MATQAAQIFASTRISDAYRTLTGTEPHRTGPDRWRARATWRGGDGWSVSLDDRRACWYDHRENEGGGVLDLVARVRGGNRSEALRWVADFAGIPLESRTLTPHERAEYARERAAFARDLGLARHWRRASTSLCEEKLVDLKAALFERAAEHVDFQGIRSITQLLACLQGASDMTLVSMFRASRENNPRLAAGLVGVAEKFEAAERRALARFIDQMGTTDGTED